MAWLRDQQLEEFKALRPAGGFRVIMADFPWPWDAYSDKGMEKSPEAQYATMSLTEIKQTPVDHLAAKDAVLFLWVTWPLQPHWQDVITSLGFEYAGLAWEWIKYNKATDKYAMGCGYGTRKNVEPCLLCTRGNPKMRPDLDLPLLGIDAPEGVRSVRDFMEYWPYDAIRAPRDAHSRKPDEQYARIETLFEGPYIELFARQRWPGWSAWGNEVGKFEVRDETIKPTGVVGRYRTPGGHAA